jgi:hypothetical protein
MEDYGLNTFRFIKSINCKEESWQSTGLIAEGATRTENYISESCKTDSRIDL